MSMFNMKGIPPEDRKVIEQLAQAYLRRIDEEWQNLLTFAIDNRIITSHFHRDLIEHLADVAEEQLNRILEEIIERQQQDFNNLLAACRREQSSNHGVTRPTRMSFRSLARAPEWPTVANRRESEMVTE